MHKNLASFETAAINQWLMDIFYFGNRVGFGKATFNLHFERLSWKQWLSEASGACGTPRVFNDITAEPCNTTQIDAMAGLRADVLDVLSECGSITTENMFSIGSGEHEPSTSLFWDICGDATRMHVRNTPAGALDESLAAAIDHVYQYTTEKTALTIDELLVQWKSYIKRSRAACKDFGALQRAFGDIRMSQFQPRFTVSAKRHRLGRHIAVEQMRAPMIAFLSPILNSQESTSKEDFSLSVGSIIHRAYGFLQGLTLDPDLTSSQCCDLIWLHISTLDMVVRLRSLLHERRMLQALDESARKVERIVII